MNGHQFFQRWQLNQHFLVEIESVQSHRYSTEISYYNVEPDTLQFYVLYIEKYVNDELYITGYLHRQTSDVDIVSKVNKNWIWTKDLILRGKHCKINILDEDAHPYVDSVKTLKLHLCRPETFFKVGNNCKLYYGDGGQCKTDFQLYVCQNLPIPNRKEIVKILLKLGKERNDWNPKAPVLDIIDPDLHPVYYPKDDWIRNRLDNIYEEGGYVKRIIRRDHSAQSAESLILNDPAHERYKYHWKPINISIDGDLENVTFLTEITGLPKTEEFESLHKDLAEIFQKMLPAFEAIGVVRKGIENTLQIVIKAQLYRIEPGTTYEGKWHTEGVTERIIAVGSYYASIDSFLDGGHLEFSLKNYPDEYYSTLRFKQNYESISTDKLSVKQLADASFVEEVDVTTGTAIVFSNDLPHRFKKIINSTDSKGYRVFVNFFVVDPKYPLSVGDEQCPLNETEILAQRERIREVLLQSQKGWGHIHYGNVGEVGYVNKNLFGQPIESFGDYNRFTAE